MLEGEHDGLHPVAQVERHQDAADVALDRRLRYDQPLRDLAVRQSARYQGEHVPLAWSELLERRPGVVAGWG